MKKTDGHFTGTGNEKLYYRVMTPDGTPKGTVIVLHGIGDHSSGVKTLCNNYVDNGYIAYAFDLRGHGNSTGIRGHINDWGEYREDLHLFVQLVTEETRDLPLYLAGHSLGGIIVLDYLIGRGEEIAGAIAIAPALSYNPSPSEKILIQVMSKLKPDYIVEQQRGELQLTNDPDKRDMLRKDSLRHNWVSPGLGSEMMDTLNRLDEMAYLIDTPLLLQYGLEDEIAEPEKLRDFFERVGAADKEKKEYPNLQHRPFDGVDRKQFYDDMNEWLERH